MLRRAALPSALILIMLLLAGPLAPEAVAPVVVASPPAGGAMASTGALELVDCPPHPDPARPHTTTMQIIDHTFHKWRQYETGSTYYIYLEEPEERPLTAAQARELLDASGEWMTQAGWPQDLRRSSGVFGVDERILINSSDSRRYPWNNVGFVLASFPDASLSRGTAFLVSPHTALTNAHVIYRARIKGWFDRLLFAPGQTQDHPGGPRVTPFGQAEPVDGAMPRHYASSQAPEADFGALFFARGFDGISTFMPLEFNATPDYVNLAGYPALVQGERDSLALWHSHGPVLHLSPELVFHRIDCSEGNSGGPIWQYHPQTNASRVVGVVAGVGTTSSGQRVNYGPRLASYNQNLIEEWLRWTPETVPLTEYTLTVGREGQGTTSPARGKHTYQEGTRVNLSAQPAAGWEFDRWVIDGRAVDQAQTAITMSSHREAVAYFREIPREFTLTVQVAGQGTVTPTPGEHTYPAGTRVELAAQPAPGWQFDRWVVDKEVVQRPRTSISLDSSLLATAHFRQEPPEEEAKEQQVTFLVGNNAYFADSAQKFMDTAPFIRDGRTFIPMRFLAQELGADLDWQPRDGPVQTVTFADPERHVTITMGQERLTVRDRATGASRSLAMDTVPILENGRTFLPFRFLAEAFDARVDYAVNPDTGRVERVWFTR